MAFCGAGASPATVYSTQKSEREHETTRPQPQIATGKPRAIGLASSHRCQGWPHCPWTVSRARRPRHSNLTEIGIHPQPPILFRPHRQSLPNRILPNVFALLLQTLVRSQHMVKRFLLPDRPRKAQHLVNPMSRDTLQALQDIHKRIRPAVAIAPRRKQ